MHFESLWSSLLSSIILDLHLQIVEVLHALLRDHVRVRGLVAVVRPDDLAAVLAGHDVGIEVGVGVRVDAVPDVRAELDEEDLPAAVGVDLLELVRRLRVAQADADLGEAGLELVDVHPAVVAVHVVEDLEKLPEPEHVQEERVELGLLHPVVAVAVQEGRLLVGAHEGRLAVEPLGPAAAVGHLDGQLVDLREANDVVAVEVEPLPQGLQGVDLDQAILAHVGVQRHPELHELVLGGRHRNRLDVGVLRPGVVLAAAVPGARARGRVRGVARVLDVRPAARAVVDLLADAPPSLPGVEEVPRGHVAGHPARLVVVLDQHGLVGVVDQRMAAGAAGDLDGSRHV